MTYQAYLTECKDEPLTEREWLYHTDAMQAINDKWYTVQYQIAQGRIDRVEGENQMLELIKEGLVHEQALGV